MAAVSTQIAKITSKGQMSIPKAAREVARLAEGDGLVIRKL